MRVIRLPINAMSEEMASAIRLEALRSDPPAFSTDDGEHWTCRDCGRPCGCSGDARLLPHIRCGLAAERN